MANKVLVVAVHPDDETLGAGGTLLKHRAAGDKIYWLIVTSMTPEMFPKDRMVQRRQEIKKVASLFGFEGVFELEVPTTQVDRVSQGDLVSKFSKVIKEIQPNVLYLPFKADVHSDHRMTFDAVYSCTKSFNYPYIQKILMMETISETEFAPALVENAFVPNSFVDISDFLEKKIKILNVFESEIKKHPFPRSIENVRALATFRGATAGFKAAEAFVLLKERIN